MNNLIDFLQKVNICIRLDAMGGILAETYGIHWFRRDLRVAGNRALKLNWQQNQGRVVGVFCFDVQFLSRPDFSINRFQFFINTLSDLQKELKDLGSDLLFMDVGPQEAFPKLFDQLNDKYGSLPKMLTFNRDYEPFARKRDSELKEFFKSSGIEVKTLRDHLLIEPHELSKTGTQNEFYQVYSPFARRWLQIFEEEEIQKRIASQKSAIAYLENEAAKEKIFSLNWNDLLKDDTDSSNILEHYRSENNKNVTVPIPKHGAKEGFKQLKHFVDKVSEYKDKRDFPELPNTSRLSPFLKNGSITVPMIIYYLKLQAYKKKKTGEETYFSELIWREFYYHILYHRPDVETQSFLPQYREMEWENNQEYFEAWKNGMTGFPIVDAGMRELKETGWMHNRVRMIVASFLTKDLLIDWKWGEKYFMETLMDGDLAPNNGGWQWAASTGCDPQPYFRIFNPWLQSKKFDAEATYMKKYLPELKDLPASDFHKPVIHDKYPSPIVDHSVQREKALKLYKITREQA